MSDSDGSTAAQVDMQDAHAAAADPASVELEQAVAARARTTATFEEQVYILGGAVESILDILHLFHPTRVDAIRAAMQRMP